MSPRETVANVCRTSLLEMIGTFLLVLIGTGAVVTAILGLAVAGAPLNSMSVSLVFGLTLSVLVLIFGPKTGCHLNPAVTLAFAFNGGFPGVYVIPYMFAQFTGAILASITLWNFGGDSARTVAALGATQPANGVTEWHAFGVEVVISFVLMLAILASEDLPRGVGALLIGAALAIGVAFGGPISGGAANPARALGPMLVSGKTDGWYLYLIGPIVGAVLAAFLYTAVRAAKNPAKAESSH